MFEVKKERMNGIDNLSNRQYNLILGGTILFGLILNILMCLFFTDFFLGIPTPALLIGYFICVLVGIFITKSDNYIYSFIGYLFVAAPVGAVLSVSLVNYDIVSIRQAVIITAIVVFVMIIVSNIYPNFFLSIGNTLFISLFIVIIVELIAIIFFHTSPTFIDWIVVIIFCGYIGFDWQKANLYPKTANNAIDSALDIYLDIINLFIRILSIIGKNKD